MAGMSSKRLQKELAKVAVLTKTHPIHPPKPPS